MVSVTVIDKVGLDRIQIMNSMFLPSAKFDMLVTWSEDDRTPCICPNVCAADLHNSRWYNSCTSQCVNLAYLGELEQHYKGRKLRPLN